MPDGDDRRPSTTQQLLELLTKVRDAIDAAQRDGVKDRAEIIKRTKSEVAVYALGASEALLVAFIENNLSTKQQKAHSRGGDDRQSPLWDLDEVHLIRYPATKHSPTRQLVVSRAKLTLEDGRQITAQKGGNIKAAIHAKKVWDWEFGLIEPLLVAHSDWLYEDAYNHLVDLGLPDPPDFDE